jgi:hypothetical protein
MPIDTILKGQIKNPRKEYQINMEFLKTTKIWFKNKLHTLFFYNMP